MILPSIASSEFGKAQALVFDSREALSFRRKCDTVVQREKWPPADLVAQPFDIRAGGTRCIDIDETLCPIGEELRLAMRGLHYRGREDCGILSMREEQRSIVKTYRPASHYQHVIARLQNRRLARIPVAAMGFVAKVTVR